mmetsp:Transcript_70818/g.139057  ORF Transcript_70818/g.139057 Transcript_70818/m.139057 type:complete len:215 (-) Transcript_70818:32-676(-)
MQVFPSGRRDRQWPRGADALQYLRPWLRRPPNVPVSLHPHGPIGCGLWQSSQQETRNGRALMSPPPLDAFLRARVPLHKRRGAPVCMYLHPEGARRCQRGPRKMPRSAPQVFPQAGHSMRRPPTHGCGWHHPRKRNAPLRVQAFRKARRRGRGVRQLLLQSSFRWRKHWWTTCRTCRAWSRRQQLAYVQLPPKRFAPQLPVALARMQARCETER